MGSKIDRVKSCDSKISHKTLLSVEYYMEHQGANLNQSYYLCKFCQNYHITTDQKQPYKNKRALENFKPKNIIKKFKLYRENNRKK